MSERGSYEEGLARLAGRRSAGDVRAALDSLDRAVTRNPGHARAWLAKADAHMLLAGYGGSPNPARELEAAATALRRAEESGACPPAYYQYVKGRVLLYKDRDVPKARAALAKAVELDPRDAGALHGLSSTYTFLAEHGEAVRLSRAALSVALEDDRGNGGGGHNLSRVMLAWSHYYAGDYQLARAQCEQILEPEPTHDHANRFLALVLALEGEHEKSLDRYRNAGAGRGTDYNLFAAYTCALALAGRVPEARENVAALRAADGYVSPYRLAQCYSAAGDAGLALAELGRARDEGDIFVMWSAVDPLLSGLKGSHRFRAYLDSVGLRAVGASI